MLADVFWLHLSPRPPPLQFIYFTSFFKNHSLISQIILPVFYFPRRVKHSVLSGATHFNEVKLHVYSHIHSTPVPRDCDVNPFPRLPLTSQATSRPKLPLQRLCPRLSTSPSTPLPLGALTPTPTKWKPARTARRDKILSFCLSRLILRGKYLWRHRTFGYFALILTYFVGGGFYPIWLGYLLSLVSLCFFRNYVSGNESV